MIQKDATYVVMGLLDSDSIAYAVGRGIESFGGKVIYTVQSPRLKKIFFDRSKKISQEEKDKLTIEFCDVTIEKEVKDLFDRLGNVSGVVHSIAYLNPKTGLGEEFHTSAFDDLKTGFHISAVSLATVTQYAQPKMPGGGAVVCMTFSGVRAWPYYNWMGVNKAALEATVRALARRHGRDKVRINAISAGPLSTKAAAAIPGFNELINSWNRCSPLAWDPIADKEEVANGVLYLLGPYSKKITGQILYVDGGECIIGGELVEHEK